MSPLIELLNEIRHRPAMYIGTVSVAKLATYLRGYDHATRQYGIAKNDRFLRVFQDWVRSRYKVKISRSWEDIIRFHSVDDDEAMKCFWELFDEFLTDPHGVALTGNSETT